VSGLGTAICEQPRIVALAGYRDWPGEIAHLPALTAADTRGRGGGRAIRFTELGPRVSIRLTSVAGVTAGNRDQHSG
jgi:hypothetical protein